MYLLFWLSDEIYFNSKRTRREDKDKLVGNYFKNESGDKIIEIL